VSVIVVTFETTAEMLSKCLESVISSELKAKEIVVVDNSTTSRVADFLGTWEAGRESKEPVLILARQPTNVGYAAATNRGIALSAGDFVLLLNPDAVLRPAALALMVEAAKCHPDAIGFAPKVTLASHELIIDSVGIGLHLGGQASQRGLGEPDIGQYATEERIAGLCFAAALVRRAAFSPEAVGLLDERYFMFYEDVDWSMRASILGETFWSVPGARVDHVHSASTRDLPAAFKSRLIQRNLVWTAAKNLERHRVVTVVPALLARQVISGLTHRRGWMSLRIAFDSVAGLPRLARSRREVQARRKLDDRSVLTEIDRTVTFDSERYLPVVSFASLVGVLSRLYAVAPTPALRDLVLRLRLAGEASMTADGARIASMVRESGVELEPGLEWSLRQLEGGDRGLG